MSPRIVPLLTSSEIMTGDRCHPDKVITVEFRVSMHCKACERSVSKALTKLKGVEKVLTDMENHRAVVVGRIEPQVALRKLRKKTGKKAEIVARDDFDGEEAEAAATSDHAKAEQEPMSDGTGRKLVVLTDGSGDGLVLDLDYLFSDENPNACSVM